MASPNSTNSNSNLSPSSLPSSSSDERSLLCTPRTRAAAKKAAELLAALKNKKVAVAKEPRSAKRSLSVVPEEPRKKVVAPTKAITLAKRRKTKKELKAEKMAEFLAADSRRPANFTAEEDVFLCRAYVNVSLDPAVGTDQSAETFWKKVKDKFTSLYKEESEILFEEAPPRPPASLLTRFQRHIQKDAFLFNAHYKHYADKKPSGWNEDRLFQGACARFARFEGRAFKFEKCVPVLQHVVKFQAGLMNEGKESITEQDSAGGKGGMNKIGRIMGDTTTRPIGQKKAKKIMRDSALVATVSSIADTGNSLAIDRVALSTEKLASVIKEKHLYDTWIKQADMWMRLGNPAKATDFLLKVEDHQKQEQAAPVTSVNFTAEEMAEQEQDKLSEPETELFEPEAELGNFSLASQLEIIDDGTSWTTSTASKDRKMSAREKTIDDEKRNRAEV